MMYVTKELTHKREWFAFFLLNIYRQLMLCAIVHTNTNSVAVPSTRKFI
jgi:hypothetical protein